MLVRQMKKFVRKVKLTGGAAVGRGALNTFIHHCFQHSMKCREVISKVKLKGGLQWGIEYKSYALCRTESSNWFDMHKNT